MNSLLDTLPSTETLINSFGLVADKKLGQNFIIDSNITDQIALVSGDLDGKIILEIGPGPGGLTRSILHHNIDKLIAVEFDERAVKILNLIQDVDPRLHVIKADALTFKEEDNLGDEKAIIIANLPYNIGTKLVAKWLYKANRFEKIIVMLQKEVVERITAEVSTSSYGRLSIFCQTLADCEQLMHLEPHHFHPAPKVESAVVCLTPKNIKLDFDLKIMEKVCEAGFAQRRKMIRSSLKTYISDKELESLNIDPTLRAENLSIENYHSIARYLTKKL